MNDRHRFRKTLRYFENYMIGKKILDLGSYHGNSDLLLNYNVCNTVLNLDENQVELQQLNYDTVLAWEIIEHLLNPYEVLRALKPCVLLATVPLNVFYAKPYWIEEDIERQHYHEFYDFQFDKLLQNTGFKIIHAEKIKIINGIGIRPLLSAVVPRYYFVIAEKE